MGLSSHIPILMSPKTTVEIRAPLLEAAKAIAKREKISLRALIEEGLETAIERRNSTEAFKLRDESFGESGLQAGIREGDWSEIRRMIYEGRGE